MHLLQLVLVLGASHEVLGTTTDFDPNHLTSSQLSAVAEFRELVKNGLTEAYMRDDYYLANWLNKKEFSIEATQKFFEEYLELRRKYNLNGILDDGRADMRAIFPYTRVTSRNGSPLIYINLGDWDLCGHLNQGESQINRFARYFYRILEESAINLGDLRAQGKTVSETYPIVNAGGFSYQKHGCLKGFHQLFQLIGNDHAKFASHNIGKVMVVNVPWYLKTIFSLNLSNELQDVVSLYGQDRQQWEPILMKMVDLNQLPKDLLSEPVEIDNLEGLLNWKNEL